MRLRPTRASAATVRSGSRSAASGNGASTSRSPPVAMMPLRRSAPPPRRCRWCARWRYAPQSRSRSCARADRRAALPRRRTDACSRRCRAGCRRADRWQRAACSAGTHRRWRRAGGRRRLDPPARRRARDAWRAPAPAQDLRAGRAARRRIDCGQQVGIAAPAEDDEGISPEESPSTGLVPQLGLLLPLPAGAGRG